jgi:hypothetical protein
MSEIERGGESMVFQCSNGGKEMADAGTMLGHGLLGGEKKRSPFSRPTYLKQGVVTYKYTAKFKPIT